MDILEKRTRDNRLFDIDCTDLLDEDVTIDSATITSDQGGLVFGTPVVNDEEVTYETGRTAAVGKALQVRISGGELPPDIGQLMCTLRPLLSTSSGDVIEATVLLRLIDEAVTQ